MRPKTYRSDYPHITTLQTRWSDNDVYGHVNNVVYYQYFDTVVNEFLISHDLLDIQNGQTIGLVVETQCQYFKPLSFPQQLEAGLRIAHLGNSSIRYELAIFESGDDSPAAEGHFVHVYVDHETRRPCALNDSFRSTLKAMLSLADQDGSV